MSVREHYPPFEELGPGIACVVAASAPMAERSVKLKRLAGSTRLRFIELTLTAILSNFCERYEILTSTCDI